MAGSSPALSYTKAHTILSPPGLQKLLLGLRPPLLTAPPPITPTAPSPSPGGGGHLYVTVPSLTPVLPVPPLLLVRESSSDPHLL